MLRKKLFVETKQAADIYRNHNVLSQTDEIGSHWGPIADEQLTRFIRPVDRNYKIGEERLKNVHDDETNQWLFVAAFG
jgi:hypothetical protein